MTKKVLIDAETNIPYSSFYIKGLVEVYGRKNVTFAYKQFARLPNLAGNMRFIIKEGNNTINVFIHTGDSYKIYLEHYDWCDIYGNVNANFNHYPKESYPKQLALVPSFGISNFNLFETIYFSISNFIKSFNKIKDWRIYNRYRNQYEQNLYKNIKRHFGNYLKNYYLRVPLKVYKNTIAIDNEYIFFLSTLWYSDSHNKNDEFVNRRRANFIEVCKEFDGLKFEGGLLPNNSSSHDLFEKSVSYSRLNLSTWLQKTKKSVLVFNTPAFWDCHGWKLGEYLALGKAIISTPLSNDLPEPLIHGKDIHIIPNSSKESIRQAIVYILENPAYRMSLEKNAQKYWNNFGEPQKALKLLGLN